MDDKDRFAAALALSDQSQKKLESRRAIEWKLKFGLWVGILFLSKFGLEMDSADRENPDIQLGTAIIYILTFGFDLVWTWSVQKSHALDQKFHLHFRSRAEKEAGVENPDPQPYPEVKDFKGWPIRKQQGWWIAILTAPTLALLLGSWLLLFRT